MATSWEEIQAHANAHKRLHELQHDTELDTFDKAKQNGYDDEDARLLANAIGRIAVRRAGGIPYGRIDLGRRPTRTKLDE